MIITIIHKIKDRIQNHLTDIQLTDYIDHLRKDTLEKVPEPELEHVEDCDKCKQVIIEMYAILEEDQTKTIPFTPVNYKRDMSNVYWKQALAVAATLVIIPGLLYFTTISSVPESVKKNFTPNRILELLVNDLARSSNLEIISPVTGEEVLNPPYLHFSWKWSKREPLTFQLFSNTNEEMISLTALEEQLEIENTFDKGLYYWQLSDKDDLLFTGKIFLR
ncbi:MAG: hypothetical protein QF472_01600 [Candidatus Marinimicrobia bacterium]|jgi:hypothetical protein|nr:hypothetical protein [Candidatus Neomarinimicrobiota bacterium]